jgi:uncharacterized protein
MRRGEKEIRSRERLDEIIGRCDVCRLGLTLGDVPYIIPVSFGYDGERLFFHTAREGRKIDFLTSGNPVCFEFERGVKVMGSAALACSWTCSFQSVIGYGRVIEIAEAQEKEEGLNCIMRHYSGREWSFEQARLAATRVWRVAIETLSGKESGITT